MDSDAKSQHQYLEVSAPDYKLSGAQTSHLNKKLVHGLGYYKGWIHVLDRASASVLANIIDSHVIESNNGCLTAGPF